MSIMQTMSNTAQVDQSDIQKFRYGKLVRGNNSVVDYYSKLKKCNEIVKISEEHLRRDFLSGLTLESVVC